MFAKFYFLRYNGGDTVIPTIFLEEAMNRCLFISDIASSSWESAPAGAFGPGERLARGQWLYVDAGMLYAVVDGQEHCLRAGEYLLCAPGQWRLLYAPLSGGADYLLVNLTVEGEGLDLLKNQPKTLKNAENILAEIAMHDPFSLDALAALLTLQLVAAARKQVDTPLPKECGLILRAHEYAEQHILDKLSVPELAAHCGLSPSYLTALFRKHLSVSPAEWIRRRKLEEGKRLIREGGRNFTEIASILRYSTVHHFSRQFKEVFGITASEYEKSLPTQEDEAWI